MDSKQPHISNNGDFLRIVSAWLDERAAARQQKINENRMQRVHDILFLSEETKTDKVKYYLKQLWNNGGFSILKLLQYMSTLANVGLVDNKALRYLESVYEKLNKDDKKFVVWLKKHPSVSSYLSYYVLVGLISSSTFASAKALFTKDSDDKSKEQKKEVVITPSKNSNKIITVSDSVPESKSESKSESKPEPQPMPEPEPESKPKVETKQNIKQNKIYNVSDDDFIDTFVSENWEDIVICMLEFETYYGVSPTQNTLEKHHTYGPGLTYVYVQEPDGSYVGHRCAGKYIDMVKNFSEIQIWEQFKIHISIRYGLLHRIRRILKNNGINEISTNKLMALLIAGYQRPKDVQGIIKNISKAKTLSAECDAFASYKTGGLNDKKFYHGTMKRRWWCAAYYAGIANSNDLLNLEPDVFTKAVLSELFDKNTQHFKFDDETLEYALSLKFDEHENKMKSDKNNFVGTVTDFIKQNKVFEDVGSVQIATQQQPGQSKKTAFNNAIEKMKRGRTYDATHLFVKPSGEYSA